MAELSRAIARLMEEQRRGQRPRPVPPPPVETAEVSEAQVAPGERTLAAQFLRIFGSAPGAAGLDERSLSALGLAAFRYLSERTAEEPRVRVFAHERFAEEWETSGSMIQILMRDRPYIVETVRECLRDADCRVRRLLAPTFQIERDPGRALLSVDEPGPVGPRETFVHVEIERHPEPQVIANLVADRLRDLILATEDEGAMRNRLEEAVAELRGRPLPRPWSAEAAEAAAYLEWLGSGTFLLLGYREYELSGQGLERLARVQPGSGLGILQSEDLSQYAQPTLLTEVLRRRMQEPPLLMLSKTNARSTVFRRDYMEYVGLKRLDAAGVVVGERRFLGLFTDSAAAQPSSEIPLLRAKLAAVLEAEGESIETRAGQRLVGLFDSLPRAEVMALGPDALAAHLQVVAAAAERAAAQVDYHPDVLDRGAVVLVTVPRERFARDMFGRTEQRLVQVSGATAVLDRHLFVFDDHARMHFFLAARADSVASFHPDELRRPVLELLRTWEDRLRDELRRLVAPHEIEAIVERYRSALPESYRSNHDIRKAARDIGNLESVRASQRAVVEFSDDPSAPGRFGVLELFHANPEFVIGDWIRSLGRLGLGVHDISSVEVRYADGPPAFIVALRVRDEHGPLDLERTGVLTVRALQRLQAGTLSDDELNALIPRAGLDWRQVDVLRAAVGYAAQAGLAPSRAAAERALVRHPQSARLLWEYFAAKFDPMIEEAPRERELRALAEMQRRFGDSLRAVGNDADVQCLRALLDVVAAATRTNYYLSSVSGTALDDPGVLAPALALEIAPGRLRGLGGRRPAAETYVDGPLVTGLHLREHAVALGPIGIYATADGLRAQLLRELVDQVPSHGASVADAARAGMWVKGSDHGARIAAAFRAFVGALLDLVDNIQEGRPRHAPGIVAYDELDSFRAIAPGRRTGGLVDTANELARQRQLWLAAGFAPLGSGEEQRALAALGARIGWDAVRRHFSEMDRDADREEISVVAAGELSAPEFVSMLLVSRRMRLLAAFDRRWIFLDPNPDAARAFSERERLLEQGARSWEMYERQAIGPGGGLYARHAPSIELSGAARDLLGLDAASVGGDDIVAAILRLPSDLLVWSGGGARVRSTAEAEASAEAPPEVGTVALDAAAIGARLVVAWDADGFTPAARVEYETGGGRFAAVARDLGFAEQARDRQANVEIAAAAIADGPRLPRSERIPVLAEAKARNAEIVRGRCRDQLRAVALDRALSRTAIEDFADAVGTLEIEDGLDRRSYALPERETLRRRRGRFLGMTHGELATLAALTKLGLRRRVRASDLPDDPFFERYLRAYFPDIVDARCGQGVRSHRLRRAIIGAELAAAVVDSMGAGFVARIRRDTGATAEAVLRAWAVVVEVGGLAPLWRAVADADPPLPPEAEARCWLRLQQAAERATRWVLRTQAPDVAASALRDTFANPVAETGAILDAALPEALAAHSTAVAEEIAGLGVPRALAAPVAASTRLAERFDIAALALEHDLPLYDVAAGYYRICDLLDLEWLDRRLAEIVPADRWERSVVLGLTDDLMALRSQFSLAVFSSSPDAVDAEAAIAAYLIGNQRLLTRIGEIIDDVTTAPRVTLTALSVVIREIAQLARGGG